MTVRLYLLVSYVLFLVMGFAHLIRLAFDADITFLGLHVPMWASVLAVMLSAFMGYWGYKLWEGDKKVSEPPT